jgi:trimeric autotransporter adhesin
MSFVNSTQLKISSTGNTGSLTVEYTSSIITQTYILPSDGTSGQVLTTNGSGVLSWSSSPTISVKLSSILAATGTNTIDSLTFAQIWNWSTATTQNPFTWSANTLTSGTLLSLNSSSVGLTGNLQSITLTGSNAANTGNLLSVNSSGASSTAICLNLTQSGTANLITASTTGSGNAISLVQTTAATSGANNNSPQYQSTATYWTGSASANDVWTRQIVLGSGSNPSSTYNLTHSGSTGTVAFQLPAGASLLFPGSTSGTVGFKPATTNTSVTWTLPAADGTSGQVLITNGSGVLSWTSSPTVSVPLNSILAATGTNTIDSLTFAQIWNWSTASTQTPFTWTANGLTSGNLFSLTSTSTGLTGNLLLVQSASTSAFTNGCVRLNCTSAHTGNTFQIDTATTTGNGIVLNANSITSGSGNSLNINGLTSGTGMSISSSSTGMTGNLMSITLSGSNAANTGNLLSVNSSGASSTATCLNLTQSGTANLITASTTGSGNAISLVQTTAATSGANNNSPQYKSTATYWTGSASANDIWTRQITLGTGSNPSSTYALTHSGSTGTIAFQLPAGASLLFPGSTSGTVGFKPATTNTSVTWQLPAADGSANQFLQTNGSAVLTWASAGTGGTVTFSNAGSATATWASASGNLWASGSNPTSTVVYKTLSDGTNTIAYLRIEPFSVTSKTGGSADSIATLTAVIPSAYRPPAAILVPISFEQAGVFITAVVQILTNGNIEFFQSQQTANFSYTSATAYGLQTDIQMSWIIA